MKEGGVRPRHHAESLSDRLPAQPSSVIIYIYRIYRVAIGFELSRHLAAAQHISSISMTRKSQETTLRTSALWSQHFPRALLHTMISVPSIPFFGT